MKKDYYVEKIQRMMIILNILEPIKEGESYIGLVDDLYFTYPSDNVCKLGYICTNQDKR